MSAFSRIAKSTLTTHLGSGVATVEVGIGQRECDGGHGEQLAHHTPRLKTSMKTGRSDQELDAGFK
jgi:hypothetical protein